MNRPAELRRKAQHYRKLARGMDERTATCCETAAEELDSEAVRLEQEVKQPVSRPPERC